MPTLNPGLAPCDSFLSPKLKSELRDRHFRTVVNAQRAVTKNLNMITREDFKHCYEEWQNIVRVLKEHT